MKIKKFYDEDTFTLTYVVWDEETKRSIVIDPVLNYDPKSSTLYYISINNVIEFIQEKKLVVAYILETHAHADHLTGAQKLKLFAPNAILAIGHRITEVQKIFKEIFNLDKDFPTNGSQFDKLFDNNESLEIDSLKVRVIPTPGHTPACCSYLINDCIFTGDALFMPDYGTGRCDFPMGSSFDLYDSITQNLFSLAENTKTYTGHDYQPNGRALKYKSTIGIQKKTNIQLNEKIKKKEFIKFRDEKDLTLDTPRLLLSSVQVNINAGLMPKTESNGVKYLKIPINIRGEK